MSSRRLILKNSLWGNLSIAVRYGLSFIATAVIASYFGAEEFGVYQLVFSYLAILDGASLLSPNHLKNYLIENPEDESSVVGAWIFQSVVLWIIVTTGIVVLYVFSEDKYFYILMLFASLRLFFKIFDYPQIIFDSRLRNDLVQKIQIFQHGVFNTLRIVSTILFVNLVALTSITVFHGLLVTAYQLFLMRFYRANKKPVFSLERFIKLTKVGFPLALMTFLSVFQSRIVGVLIAERMGAGSYGSFQLVFRLLEPVMAIGLVVFGANYTMLAQTRKQQPKIFTKRFLKIGALTICVSLFFSSLILLVPIKMLIRIFGESFSESFEYLWMGVGMVVSGAIFAVSIQYDVLSYRYKLSLLKYLLVIGFYCLVVHSYQGQITLQWAFLLYSIVPIAVSFLSLMWDLVRK